MRQTIPQALLTGATALLSLGVFVTSPAKSAGEPVNPTEALLWANEQKIYAGRAHGSLQYYLEHTSPEFLAWPPIADKPINNDGLKKGAALVSAGHELIKSELVGFTQDGDTAVIYYVNHRTMRPDGTPVDERFANIHVWIKRNGNWVLLGGMARQLPPPAAK